ncbi:MAG: cation transporter [Clostridia bacterium]|nr:cation transporter [Clostridia bacterium]
MKTVYIIEGLDCANCASKLERAIQKIDGIKSATISFFTGKLVVEYEENREEIFAQIEKTIKKEEPDVKVRKI